MIRQRFDEKLSLTIFKKIAELVDSLHKIGLTHTNLELDNFLLDANKNLKISGFSSMQFIQKEINNFQNDNFHLSILLFQLLTGKCYIKNQESQFLKIIQEGKLSFFWKSIELQNNQKFSQKIKNLINKMFQAKNIIIDLDEEKVYNCGDGTCLGKTLLSKCTNPRIKTFGEFLGNIII